MCGPESPMILELDEVPMRKFQCQDCEHIFKLISRTPKCPKCQSVRLVQL